MKLNRKNLKSLILEVLEESEYYDKYKDMDTDYATQAMELGQSMGDEGARDRSEQVEKYVRLKVDKEIKKDMLSQTRQTIQELVDETRGVLGISPNHTDQDDYDREQLEGFRKMYSKKLAPAMELAQNFDGTQENLDQWAFRLMTIEKELYKSKDPAMYYLGSIIPYGLHIGEGFFQSYLDDADPDFGGVSRKYVDIETAVKGAEDFYRPGITKMVLKAQSAESGMDLGGMFGLNESIRDMFESEVSSANNAIELLINAGIIPEPQKIHIDERFQSIDITFDSSEDVQELANLLRDMDIPEQKGGGWTIRPRFVTFETTLNLSVAPRHKPSGESFSLKI